MVDEYIFLPETEVDAHLKIKTRKGEALSRRRGRVPSSSGPRSADLRADLFCSAHVKRDPRDLVQPRARAAVVALRF